MQFYVMDFKVADWRFYAGGQWVNGETIRCPVCGVTKELPPEPLEIYITLDHLGRWGFTEVLWNSTLPIFRQDLIDWWHSAGLTGFQTKPVRVVGWSRKRKKPLPDNIPQYYCAFVTGRARYKLPPCLDECSVCGFVRYDWEQRTGIYVDESTWDGSDFFNGGYYGFLDVCTRRVAEVTLRAGYNRRIAFIRAEQWRTWEDYSPRKGWTGEAYDKYREGFYIRRVEDL